jgi:protein TonB
MYAIFLGNRPDVTCRGGVGPIVYIDTTVFEPVMRKPPKEKLPEVNKRQDPTPNVTTKKFTVPLVVEDEKFLDTTKLPTQNDFTDALAGTQDRKGDSTATVMYDPIDTMVGKKKEETPPWVVEIMPEFPGGQEKMFRYLYDELEYPEHAKDNGIEGTVYVQFVVDRDGSLTDIVVAKGPHKWLNDEGLRVVKAMPRWKPGKQNGQTVKVRYVLPIKFKLGKD